MNGGESDCVILDECIRGVPRGCQDTGTYACTVCAILVSAELPSGHSILYCHSYNLSETHTQHVDMAADITSSCYSCLYLICQAAMYSEGGILLLLLMPNKRERKRARF